MNKRRFFIAVVATILVAFLVSPGMAKQYLVGGKTLNVFGYVTQGVAFSLHGADNYDTEQGLQSAIFNFFLEGDYKVTDNLKFYGAGMLTADWVYDLKHDDRSWNDKMFSQSRDKLQMDDEYWQLLKEAHLTWTPGDFMFRVGKQIVAWGETDGFRLMDQINPLDQRRGMADVEFETSIIPIWLLRADYYPQISSTWLDDLGFEFIFNPNADFIPNQGFMGNDEGGIWSPNVLIPLGPGVDAHLGSGPMNIEEPDTWSEGREFGFRVKGVVNKSIITLNYFYGRENAAVTKMAAVPPSITVASDGKPILHATVEGYYPLLRIAGATFSREVTPLRASFLGDVAPVVRLEGFYAFDNTFTNSLNAFEKFDELRWALGIDWKIKIGFLNPRTYFNISPQIYHRKILDYPSDRTLTGAGGGTPVQEDNYMTTLMINTSYFHNKIAPSFFWMHDVDNHADMYKLQLTYDYSNKWRYTLGALFLNGQEPGNSFQVFENKDYLYFKISYKWG